MEFPFEVIVNLDQSNIIGAKNFSIKVHGGITTLLGPNGSGKTQLLRGLKGNLYQYLNGKK